MSFELFEVGFWAVCLALRCFDIFCSFEVVFKVDWIF